MLLLNAFLGQLKRSDLVRQWLTKYNATTLAEIHPSLNNIDRLRMIMYRQRALENGLGQDLEGNILQPIYDRVEGIDCS